MAKRIQQALIIYIVGTILGFIWAGIWFNSSNQVTVWQVLTGYETQQAAGTGGVGILKLGLGFITTGLPTILFFNWPYLSGELLIIKLILIALITIPLLLDIWERFLPALSGIWATIRGLLPF